MKYDYALDTSVVAVLSLHDLRGMECLHISGMQCLPRFSHSHIASVVAMLRRNLKRLVNSASSLEKAIGSEETRVCPVSRSPCRDSIPMRLGRKGSVPSATKDRQLDSHPIPHSHVLVVHPKSGRPGAVSAFGARRQRRRSQSLGAAEEAAVHGVNNWLS